MLAISLHGSICQKTAILYIISKTLFSQNAPARKVLDGIHLQALLPQPSWAVEKVKGQLPPLPSAEKRTHQETSKLYRSACSVTARNLL